MPSRTASFTDHLASGVERGAQQSVPCGALQIDVLIADVGAPFSRLPQVDGRGRRCAKPVRVLDKCIGEPLPRVTDDGIALKPVDRIDAPGERGDFPGPRPAVFRE